MTLALDGAETARGFVDVPANGRARKRFVLTAAGGHEAEVAIDHDDFPLDDSRVALVEAARGLRSWSSTATRARSAPRTRRSSWRRRCGPAAAASRSRRCCPTSWASGTCPPPARSSSPTSAAPARRRPPRWSAMSAVAAACSCRSATRSTPTDGIRRWAPSCRSRCRWPAAPRRCPARAREGETVDTRPAERLAPFDRRHPLLSGFPARGEGLSSARFFEYMLLAPGAGCAGPPDPAAVRKRRARAGRDPGRARAGPAADDVGRSRVDRPADPPRVPAAGSRSGPLPGGRPVRRGNRGAGRRRKARDPAGRRREAPRGGSPGRRFALADPAFARPTPSAGAPSSSQRPTSPAFTASRGARADGTIAERPDASFVVDLDPGESDPARLPDERRPDAPRRPRRQRPPAPAPHGALAPLGRRRHRPGPHGIPPDPPLPPRPHPRLNEGRTHQASGLWFTRIGRPDA